MLSEHETEDRIRTALRTQADRAPSAAEFLADLDARRTGRRRRQRTLGVVLAAAAVVAVAVAVPVVLRPGTTTPAGVPGVALRYAPTWVPPGWVQTGRDLDTADPVQRIQWQRGSADDLSSIALHVSSQPDPFTATEAGSERVEINGVAGRLTWGHYEVDTRGVLPPSRTLDQSLAALLHEQEALVTWSPAPGVVITVTIDRQTDGRADALRLARSVVARPGGGTDIPMTVPPVPPKSAGDGIAVSGTAPDRWTATVGSDDGVFGTGQAIERVSWGPGVPNPLAGAGHVTEVTVRGGPGYVVTPRSRKPSTVNGFTLVPDPSTEVAVRVNGWWLVVTGYGPVTKADLVRVANGTRVRPTATFPWLGRP
jgi:hypothetical protein